jgi:hypothetical protein
VGSILAANGDLTYVTVRYLIGQAVAGARARGVAFGTENNEPTPP